MNRSIVLYVIVTLMLTTSVYAEKTESPRISIYVTPDSISGEFERVSDRILGLIASVKETHPKEDHAALTRALSHAQQRVADLTKRSHVVVDTLKRFDKDGNIPPKFYSPRHLELEVLRLDLLNELEIVGYILAMPHDKPGETPQSGGSTPTEDEIEAEDDQP